ncbi:L-lactate dehydrogenase [Arthrobacter sp. Hiyo4]|nr:L-lactate dehydrogenase [Arthrobacter sp. Hiyo4]
MLDGAYGISGVALSLPSILGHGGVRRVLRTPMDDGELTALQHYADTLPDTMSKLGI